MLEKMLDLKNTFEGKFLAVLMSVVLVMSMTNILAFAGNEGQKDGSKTESAPTDQVVGESDKEAVDEAVQHGESAAAKDADASKTTPSQPLVSTTVDEAVVTFETQNAFVSVKDRYRQESCALFRQPHKPAVRCGYPSSRVTSR